MGESQCCWPPCTGGRHSPLVNPARRLTGDPLPALSPCAPLPCPSLARLWPTPWPESLKRSELAPVTGRLADGGTFHGRLTVQAVTVDADGQLVAAGVLSGTATPTAGRPAKVPARPFAAPVAVLDLRGTCMTLVLDLAPLTVAPLAQPLTPVPMVLTPQAAPKAERLLQETLCTMVRFQEDR